ncbi:MAG: ATP-binding protein [Candidatus Scalindua sp.]
MKFTKFGNKLFSFFLLISILPLSIAGVIVYKYVYDRTKDEVLNQLRTAVYNHNDKLHLLLTKRRFRVVDFSSDGFIRDCVERIYSFPSEYPQICEKLNTHLIINKKGLDPDILGIEVLDNKGEVIASTSPEQTGTDKSQEDYFRGPFLSQEQQGSYFADAIKREENTEELQLVFSVMLTDKILHRPLGVLVTKVKGGILQDIIGVAKRGSGGHGGEEYIVNGNKLMIASSNADNKSVALDRIIDTEHVCDVLASKGEVLGVYENYRGVRVLGSAMYVPETNWVILSEKNIKDAFLPLARIKYIFIISGGGAIFLVFIFAFVISGNINAIVNKLIRGTRRIADGDLEHPITIGKRNDEIKELCESFNLMMNKLRESDDKSNHLFLQVKRGRDEWQKTFDAITDIITIHDKDFRIIMANKAFFEKFNFDKKQLSETRCHEIFHGAENPWYSCPLERTITSLQPECEEVDDPHMGGIFFVSTYPLLDENKEIYGVVHMAKDITSQKNVERQLIKKANELVIANRELEDFVYIVSHDLKEPLFAIEGYASKISMDNRDAIGDKGRYRIERIRSNTTKMSQKIHEILEVLKVGRVSYNFRNNNIGDIVKDVLNSLENRIKTGNIHISIQEDLPTVLCDRERLMDVFSNLITNAIKFMNGEPKRIRIGCDKDDCYYKFFVEDTGIGIREEYCEQIFKIFRRLNDIEVEGTGVGLAIVKKIIELHNGKVWVESSVNGGKGSKFYFTIPMKGEHFEGVKDSTC